jgi:hypothetical protein
MNKVKVTKYLPEMIGKTIERVCYIGPENNGSMPAQVIFEFTDGSNFEIYNSFQELSFTGLLNFTGDEKYLDRIFNSSKDEGRDSILADAGNVSL